MTDPYNTDYRESLILDLIRKGFEELRPEVGAIQVAYQRAKSINGAWMAVYEIISLAGYEGSYYMKIYDRTGVLRFNREPQISKANFELKTKNK